MAILDVHLLLPRYRFPLSRALDPPSPTPSTRSSTAPAPAVSSTSNTTSKPSPSLTAPTGRSSSTPASARPRGPMAPASGAGRSGSNGLKMLISFKVEKLVLLPSPIWWKLGLWVSALSLWKRMRRKL